MGAASLSAQQVPAYEYDFVSRVRMPQQMGMPPRDTTARVAHVVTTATALRMDAPRSSQVTPIGDADYTLFDGTTVRSISNATRTITVMGGPEVLSAMGQMTQMMPVSMKLSDVSSTADSLGPGETLLGMPTSRWRTTTAVTLTFSAMDQSIPMRQRFVTEYWVGPMLQGALDPRSAEVKLESTNDSSALSELTRIMVQSTRRLPKGLVLKSVTAMTLVADMPEAGMSMQSEVSAEIQNLRRVQVDPHLFDVPAGYKVVSFADRMREAMDSLRSALPKKP